MADGFWGILKMQCVINGYCAETAEFSEQCDQSMDDTKSLLGIYVLINSKDDTNKIMRSVAQW